MGFGDSITALLETYSNCVSLLKSLRHPKSGSDGAAPDKQQVTLLKSLKKDRDLVERAYSSRLSESGGRFKKGDARAISSLDRILKRIRATIANLLRLSGKEQKPVLDYDSLMSLSNASRVEAIRTINHLSRRLGSNNSSRASMTYTSTAGSSSASPPPLAPDAKPAASASRHKGHSSRRSSHGSSHSSSTTSKSRNKSPPSAPKKKKSSSKVKSEEKLPRVTEESLPGSKEEKPPKPKAKASVETIQEKPATAMKKPTVEFSTDGDAEAKTQSRPVGIAQRIAAARENRISIASFTSDSTKLGEIPDRKPRSRYYTPASPGSDEYNVPPLYPLRPYRAEAREKAGFWGGLFGRKREG
ncbi:hypothetical protein B0T14DRAFT_562548 [Immersiella caudata]|uniref:Uncharacterized protein n=1 Tax=Immersiella caudata TaxID=314043 RepID=A0AA40C6E4_9PEZI|nr:hypothetical protein B0T14DRAFT_562548 [Immersiella caudata]